AQDSAQVAPDSAVAPDTSSAPRLVSGRIVRPGTNGMLPVPGIWVTLHRVGSDTAGPVDSMRARPGGRYAFRYQRTGSADAVYFVSASYEGIAYFSLPLQKVRVTGTDGEVTVFDTTSGPIPLRVRGRHIVIAAPSVDGSREIVEVYELTNDSSLTVISPDDAHPIWTARLPAGERDFSAGQSDVSIQAIREQQGVIGVSAPFAPGLKQISFAYHVPAAAFPLHLALDHAATVLEVLTEEPAVKVTGARLAQVAPVSIDGRAFQRFTAQDVPEGAAIQVDAPVASEPPMDRRLVIGISSAVGALMLLALVWVVVRSPRRRLVRVPAASGLARSAAAGHGTSASADALAREIASLDASFEADAAPSDTARAAYQARRAELKGELTALLDARNANA
ncbi:MAG: hypothetical protein ACREOJ_07845, partial [Gemmatimonadaceae bacterium]